MKLKELKRDTVKLIAEEMTTALKHQVADNWGIKVEYKGSRYSAKEATFKFRIEVDNPNLFTKEQTAYNYKRDFGHPWLPELNTVVRMDKDDVRIMGWNTRAPKYPIKVERVHDGKRFKLPVSYLKSLV